MIKTVAVLAFSIALAGCGRSAPSPVAASDGNGGGAEILRQENAQTYAAALKAYTLANEAHDAHNACIQATIAHDAALGAGDAEAYRQFTDILNKMDCHF